MSVFIDGECGFVAAFREGHGACVAHHLSVVVLFKLPQVRVAIEEKVVFAGRLVLLVKHMSVSEKQSASVVHNHGIG